MEECSSQKDPLATAAEGIDQCITILKAHRALLKAKGVRDG